MQGSLQIPQKPIDDYKTARASLSFHQYEMNGKYLGDPDKAARTLIKISEEEKPPLHLFLGQDAYVFSEDIR